MIGLRYRVGGDALSYEYYYVHMPDLADYIAFIKRDVSFNYQPLYLLFVALCKSINPDYYFYQLIHAIVVNGVITWFLYKNTQKFFTAILWLYILGIYFYFTFDIQREILAICCFLLGYNAFQKNRWIVYYIYALLGFFFHISASILLLLPLFKVIRLKPVVIYIIVAVSLALVYFKSVFYNAISFLLVTEAMANKGKAYSEMEFSLAGLVFFFFGRVVLFLPFIITMIKNKDKAKEPLITAMLIFVCFAQVMVGFERMFNYLIIPLMAYIADFIYDKKIYKLNFKKNLVIFSTYMSLFFIVCIKIVLDWNVTDRARYQAVFFPYSSVFDQEENPERENYMIELWKR